MVFYLGCEDLGQFLSLGKLANQKIFIVHLLLLYVNFLLNYMTLLSFQALLRNLKQQREISNEVTEQSECRVHPLPRLFIWSKRKQKKPQSIIMPRGP
ncbi:hypothetical protein BGP_0590 [Beggiatoa sp. PS]|nr:hypothetical protein BGP_0590 [Beggiatoa sp. PS]